MVHQRPSFALFARFALLATVTAAIVNPGNFGSIDTEVRLQAERWIRLGEPVPTGGATFIGKGGVRYAGMGQSLVLMPFDAIASTIAEPPLRRLGMSVEKQRQAAEVLTAFLMQSFLASATVVLAYGLLRTFEFSCFVSSAGALSLLFGTTCLTYVQNAQENLLLLSLALASLCCLRQWRKDGVAWWAAAGTAYGFALLVRLTSCMEIAVFGALGWLWGTNARRFLTGFALPLVAAGLLERWYQWRRFGGWFTTYAGFAANSLGATDLIFSYPFWKGFWGTLGSPDKSVLLFDPLLLILVAIAAWGWRVFAKDLRMLLVSLGFYTWFTRRFMRSSTVLEATWPGDIATSLFPSNYWLCSRYRCS